MVKIIPKSLLFSISLCALIFYPFSTNAQYILSKNNLPEKISLHSHAWIVDVGEKDLDFKSFLEVQKGLRFNPIVTENADLGFTDHHFWVTFQIKNETDTQQFFFFRNRTSYNRFG